MLGMLVGCGAVGPLTAPENVGVNATIERQKRFDSLEEKRRKGAAPAEATELEPDSVVQGQDVNLPPLHPVGTR
jgi:hypothetical protein